MSVDAESRIERACNWRPVKAEVEMVDIILTKEQTAAITKANGRIRFVSEDGAVSAVAESIVRPVDWDSLPETDKEELRRRLEVENSNLLSTKDLIDRLQKRFPE